jgi:hypothetical protein
VTLVATPLRADWINLTGSETAPNIAEIYVLDDRVHVKLEVYIGDLEKFADLVPDDWLRDASGRASLDERLERFSREGLQFVTDKGEQLIAKAVTIEPRLRVDRQSPFAGMINPITRARVPDAPADKRVLYVELDYPFAGKPESLQFIPPLDDDADIASVVLEVQEREPQASPRIGPDDLRVRRTLRSAPRDTDAREGPRGMDGPGVTR